MSRHRLETMFRELLESDGLVCARLYVKWVQSIEVDAAFSVIYRCPSRLFPFGGIWLRTLSTRKRSSLSPTAMPRDI